jgi:hypothetical protein
MRQGPEFQSAKSAVKKILHPSTTGFRERLFAEIFPGRNVEIAKLLFTR